MAEFNKLEEMTSSFSTQDTFSVVSRIATDDNYTLMYTYDEVGRLDSIVAENNANIIAINASSQYLNEINHFSVIAQHNDSFDAYGVAGFAQMIDPSDILYSLLSVAKLNSKLIVIADGNETLKLGSVKAVGHGVLTMQGYDTERYASFASARIELTKIEYVEVNSVETILLEKLK